MIDFTPYAYTLDDRGWEADDLHIQMLFDKLMETRPASAMEIGSYRGRSAIAFVEALKAGLDFTLHLVEPHPMPSLLRLIEESGFAAKVKFHVTPAWELLEPVEFVFVDGDHTWPCLADVLTALALGTRVIAMHDTRGKENGYHGCWGSYAAARVLEKAVGRVWFEDAGVRPGMRTQRGLGISELT